MRYFNTTLVTVYLPKFIHLVFQKEFQYNSCYCLSPWAELPECNYSNFNTTLVTVYLYLILVSLDFFCDFNTTLVTVYLKGLARYDQTS